MPTVARLICAAVFALTPVLATMAAVTPQDGCAPRDGLEFICGIGAIEDLAPIPGTRYLLAGGMRLSGPAPIRWIDSAQRTLDVAWPRPDGVRADRRNYPECPGPPDASRLSTTGLALQPLTSTGSLLLAVNEGDRRAIEVFEVETGMQEEPPRLTWVGCVPMPAGTNPNAVTPLDGRGMAIVSMDDGSPDRMERHIAGEALGTIWLWRPGADLARIPGLRLGGGNGIESSSDGRWLYASAWSGAQIVRLAVDGSAAPQVTNLPFLPDNLKRQADGSLLVAAQRPPVARIARCGGPSCPADWLIARVDPETLQWIVLHEAPGDESINYATGAVEHNGRLWITGRGDGRIGVR